MGEQNEGALSPDPLAVSAFLQEVTGSSLGHGMTKQAVSILLIEDNPADAWLIRDMLQQATAFRPEMQHAGTLCGGLDLVKRDAFQIILLDLSLPDSEGLESLKTIMQSAAGTPVLVLTGLDDQETGVEALRCGAQDYLIKGRVDEAALSRSIRYAMERHRTQHALRESEVRYRSLFEHSPVALREEDLSNVKRHISRLTASGVQDLDRYLLDHPEEVEACARKLRVRDANRAMIELYEAEDKKDFLGRFATSLHGHRSVAFCEELVAIASGDDHFECETVARSFTGRERRVIMRWSAAPGHAQTLKRVWVSMLDVTERRRAETALHLMEHELLVAREIQSRLYPKAAPSVPGYDIAGACCPARIAGGDYFDFLPLRDGSLGIVIGDASGHGIDAALIMVSVQSCMRSFSHTYGDIGKILEHTNRLLVPEIPPDRFCTAFLGQLDVAGRSLSYVSAGHETGYVLSPDGEVKAALESLDIPLGCEGNASFSLSSPLPLDSGDMVLLLTDGIREAVAPDASFFDLDRILDVVRANRQLPATDIIETLYQAVLEFQSDRGPADDITAVVVKVESDSCRRR